MPWKRTEIILSFLRLHPSTAFQTAMPYLVSNLLTPQSIPYSTICIAYHEFCTAFTVLIQQYRSVSSNRQDPKYISSWTINKAEHQRIDAFELWCWKSLLRVPWTARRFNQSILKAISPGISLEVMMLKLKLQYFGYLIRRVDSLEGIGGRRRRG